MPTSLQSLDLATIVLFGILFLLTIPILKKHTAKKEVPWIWLSGACAFRIISASVGYVAGSSPTKNEVTAITSSLVPIFLVVVFTEIVNRVLTSLVRVPAEKRAWVNVFALIAVIVGIIGGVRSSNTTNVKTQQQGQKFVGIAATMIFVQFVLATGLLTFAIVLLKQQGRGGVLPPGEWRLLMSAVGSVPFLLVRTLFFVVVAWKPDVEEFKFPSAQVAAMAIWIALGLVMEVAVTGMFVVGGLFVPRIPEGQVMPDLSDDEEKRNTDVETPKEDDGLERGCTK